jgi:parallel beta-helix repeat protein
MKPASAYVRMLVASLGLLSVAFAGQGVQRLLYTTPNSTFVSQPTGEVLVTVNDTSGSIATLQTEINNARTANPSNVIVINLASVTYTVSTSSLTLGSNMCLVATGATIKASNSAVTVPLISISSGSTLVSVGGGVLDGNGANIQGINAPAAARVNIDKVIVKNCGQDCILLKGQGLTTYDNEMTVTRCEVFGSAAHAGISIQNSTQSYVGDNFCHDNQEGIYLSAAWGIVANNVCSNNTNGINVAGGNDNVVANNTCNNNAVGIKAGATGGMILSNAMGGNSTAGISSVGTSNNFLDNLFTTGNAANFSSGGTTDNIIAYKAALSASGQNYFYPPLIDNQHTNSTIVGGMGRFDLTIGSTSIDSVQTQYNNAITAHPNTVIVLHLTGTYTVGASPLTLSSNTCVLLSGTIQIDSSTTATKAISISGVQNISISGGTIDASGLTGHQGIYASAASMVQVDGVTIQNFGSNATSNPGSDALQFTNCSTPNEVTRCVVNNSGSRGFWEANYSTKGKVLYAANTVHGTRAGLDCDSVSYGIVALFNDFSSNTYGLWCEQSAQHNLGIGNVANTCARTEFVIGNLDHSPGTNYNTYISNTTAGGSRAINTSSTQTGTTATETSHNFLFNNVVVAGSITSTQTGTENHYSQNYLASGGSFNTSGAETIFNSVGVDGATYLVGTGSGLPVLVQGASTTSGAAVVVGAVSGLGNDQWDLIPTGDGYYTLANKLSGLVVAIQGASTSAGAPAIQAAYGTAQNDQWMIMSAGNGTYYCINRLSGLCLDVPAGAVGTQLDQQPYTGATNQTFALNLNAPPPVVVASPTFSPGAGSYSSAQSVTISTTTSGASIRYTTDGSTPSETVGTLYSGPVSISSNTTLQAIAYETGMTDSSVASAAYSIQAAAPTFTPGAGTYTSVQSVTIATTTSGASIRYTTDGSTPTETNGTLYSGPVTVGSSETLKAIAYSSSYADSGVSSAGYTINLPSAAAPTFSPAGGSYTTAQSVTISSTTSGASIRYTTDGSTPSETAGTLYTGPVTVSAAATLKAIAYESGFLDSSVSSATYTIGTATEINDTDAGIVYTGTWSYGANRTHGEYQADVHFTSANGDSVSYTFNGTGISFITETYTDEGNVSFYIDNVLKQTVSCVSSTRVAQVAVFTASGLAPGSHTLKAVKVDGTYMLIDALIITATPTYTITASAGSNGSISPTGPVTVNQGANQTFTITPNSGYSVSSVTVDGTNVGAVSTYTFSNVQANHTISATFSTTTSTEINDTDAGIVYTGTWSYGANRTHGEYQADVHFTSANGDSVSYTFNGTGISFITETYTDEGNVSFYIDNVFQQTVSCVSSTRVAQVAVFTASGLASGSHTLKAVKIDGTYMLLDALIITNTSSPVAAPTFTPGGGTYSSAQTVTIGTTTMGATIRYTVDGSTPSETNGTIYTGPIVISSNSTLKAIAYKSGMTDSTVTSANYAFTVTLTSANGFYNQALPAAKTGTFTVQFDASASISPSNSLIGLSQGNAALYADIAASVRFNTSGDIDARNGGAFAAASTIPFTAGTSYHFRLVINVTAHTYSAYVTPAGGSEILIGSNYAFRTEQAGVTQLDTWNADVNATPGGSLTVSNFVTQ